MNYPINSDGPVASRPQRRWQVTLLALLLSVPMLASANRKDDTEVALAEAKVALEAAERAGAPEQAPLEMKAARDQLDAARQQADEREWVDAQRSAQRAQHDALLAEARSRQQRAEALTAEIEAGIASLQAEIKAGN